jgi:hypothetical protein
MRGKASMSYKSHRSDKIDMSARPIDYRVG